MHDADTTTSRPSRADAVRNRERVERAASEVFAEQGMQASVADIAARAGVGNATVYRSYPTKVDLLAEVALRWLAAMEDVTRAAEVQPDPVTAFRELIHIIFQRLRQDRLATDLLRAGNVNDEVATARRSVEARTVAVLRRAVNAGAVRDDVTYADLSILILGTAASMTDMGQTEPAAWQRMADFVLAAVAPAQ